MVGETNWSGTHDDSKVWGRGQEENEDSTMKKFHVVVKEVFLQTYEIEVPDALPESEVSALIGVKQGRGTAIGEPYKTSRGIDKVWLVGE